MAVRLPGLSFVLRRVENTGNQIVPNSVLSVSGTSFRERKKRKSRSFQYQTSSSLEMSRID